MRITKESPLSKYLDIKKAVYFDSKCVVSPTENGFICIFREPNGIASKRQREWMKFVFDRVAKRELGSYDISETKTGHFYLLATKKRGDSDAKSQKSKSK